MSIKLVEQEIRRFLSSEEPEVISISGRWGVGKTFAWRKFVKDAQAENKIALKRYSYVSLFGINSLDELKYSVFENSVKSSDIGIQPSLETLRSNTSAAFEQMVRKALGILQNTPLLNNYVGGAIPVLFSAVRGTVICVDDFERRGKNLSVRDVLGLINNLREEKDCKVCLILNEDALKEDGADFRKYLEKVVDTALEFRPSAEECASVALPPSSPISVLLSKNVIALGIKNIRLIKRIERSTQRISSLLKGFDPQVLAQAAHSLTLLGWSIFEPEMAPSLEYLQNRRGAAYFGVEGNKTIPPNEAAWNALLDTYGFRRMDEFDLALLQGIRDGFFDESAVKGHASALDDQIKAGQLGDAFFKAWDRYHNSFDNNEDAVLDEMYNSFLKSVKYITPPNMSATVSLFKALGRQKQAAEMIQHYTTSRGEEREIFNLRNYPFAQDVKDPDVIKAFNDKYATFKVEREPKTILLKMADSSGWSHDDITFLSSLAVDEYRKLFKNNRGPELRRLIDTCLQFDRIINAPTEMKEISNRAKDALGLIGRESSINARRVKTYGVEVQETNAKAEGLELK